MKIVLDVETKKALVGAVAALHLALESAGRSGAPLHRKLRALEDMLGASPNQPISIQDEPPQVLLQDQIDALLRAVVPGIDRAEFDSHDVIRRLAHIYQCRYIAILAMSPGNTPFQDVHGRIGKRLKVLAPELELSEGVECVSRDAFGQNGRCVTYRRTV